MSNTGVMDQIATPAQMFDIYLENVAEYFKTGKGDDELMREVEDQLDVKDHDAFRQDIAVMVFVLSIAGQDAVPKNLPRIYFACVSLKVAT